MERKLMSDFAQMER